MLHLARAMWYVHFRVSAEKHVSTPGRISVTLRSGQILAPKKNSNQIKRIRLAHRNSNENLRVFHAYGMLGALKVSMDPNAAALRTLFTTTTKHAPMEFYRFGESSPAMNRDIVDQHRNLTWGGLKGPRFQGVIQG